MTECVAVIIDLAYPVLMIEGSNIETGDIFSTQNSQLVPQGIFPGKLENFSARGIDLAKLVGARAWD